MELLVVISIIGILAGVTISILNPVKQRKVAEDGVKKSNLQKYAIGMEAYASANNGYPSAVSIDAGNVPTAPTDLVNFLAKVPNGEPPSSTYNYYYDASASQFSVVVAKSEDTNYCFKYRSNWGKIKTCPIADCQETDPASCL